MRPTGALLFLLAASAAACAAQVPKEPAPTWPWPGPTPPDIREALMVKGFARRPTQAELQQIEAAAPARPIARPRKARRVLCWGRLWTHLGNAFTEESVKILGRKTGAFEVVAGDDPRLLLPESLKTFDALFLNGLHDPQPFLPLNWKKLPPDELAAARKLDAEVKQSVLDFVMKGGKGIAGIEGSLAALGDWKEYGEMMGATYNGHYRHKHTYRVEEPGHPVAAALGGREIVLDDQSYLPGPPYSRKNLRVLLSLDLTKTPDPTSDPQQAWLKEHVKRQQDSTGLPVDWAVSWVRRYGKGRVFYCSLGVDWHTYLDPAFLRYLLAGIQFATGDLQAPTTPIAR